MMIVKAWVDWINAMGGVININEQALKRADAKIMDALSALSNTSEHEQHFHTGCE